MANHLMVVVVSMMSCMFNPAKKMCLLYIYVDYVFSNF